MKVSKLGEFGLVDLLGKMVRETSGKQVALRKKLLIGIGDDAAAWQGDASIALATTESLVQDVHFTLDTTTWQELGGKALAISLSDIAAMGGMPRYALVSLGLPGNVEVEDVVDLYRGILDLGQHFDVLVAGGNVTRAPVVSITTTVLGNTSSQHVLTRSAARVGEKVAVTGYLGAAAAGHKMLREQLAFDSQTEASLRQAFLRPCPRVAEGRLLVDIGVKAAIDISDGLLADLGHVCRASQVGARIYVGRVPVHPDVAAGFGDDSRALALSGGEDYELLFTADAGLINQVKARASCPVTVIGDITADETGRVTPVDEQGKPITPAEMGWQHFSSG